MAFAEFNSQVDWKRYAVVKNGVEVSFRWYEIGPVLDSQQWCVTILGVSYNVRLKTGTDVYEVVRSFPPHANYRLLDSYISSLYETASDLRSAKKWIANDFRSLFYSSSLSSLYETKLDREIYE